MREHLTFANVVSCVALFVALGGSALAIQANSVGSRQVRDESLKGKDVRDGMLKGKDLAAGSIGERELARSAPTTELASGSGSCDPVSSAFVECVAVSLNLSQPSRVVLVAGGGQHGAANATGSCKFIAGPETLLGSAAPSFGDVDARTLGQANGLALTAVAGVLDRIQPGSLSFRLLCNQTSLEDVKFQTTLSAVAFGDGLG